MLHLTEKFLNYVYLLKIYTVNKSNFFSILSITYTIFKKGKKENIKDYSPINLLSVIYKFFTNLYTRLESAQNYSAQYRKQA